MVSPSMTRAGLDEAAKGARGAAKASTAVVNNKRNVGTTMAMVPPAGRWRITA